MTDALRPDTSRCIKFLKMKTVTADIFNLTDYLGLLGASFAAAAHCLATGSSSQAHKSKTYLHQQKLTYHQGLW